MTVGDQDYEIPALPAADWLPLLLGDKGVDAVGLVLAFLDQEDQDALEEAMSAGEVDIQRVSDTGLELLETVSGRDWWVTLRLVSLVAGHWDTIGADLLSRGVDPERLSLAAWLDVLTLHVIRNLKEDSHSMFYAQLQMPPPSEVAAQMEQVEEMTMTTDAFMAFAR